MKRRSVRKFTEESVSDADIDELMHAAMSGPSACNMKPWEFYVISNSEKLAALRGVTKFSGIVSPLAIVVCGDKLRTLPAEMSEFWVQDCSAATENILLRAVELGLGAVWCGVYPHKAAAKKVAEILGLSVMKTPLNIIYLGHPDQFPEARDQYSEKNVHYIR